MKILLGDFNAKVSKEDIFKPTIGNANLHEISNHKGVRRVNFATSINLTVKRTMFSHRSIHKYTLTSPHRKTLNRIDHILIDTRRHSNVLDVRSYRAADCDTDHYLVVANVTERLAVNKQTSHNCHSERLNLKKLNEAEGKGQFRVEVSNRCAPLKELDNEVDISSVWETIEENVQISAKESLGYFELKKHKYVQNY
jgi:hypothetical protein